MFVDTSAWYAAADSGDRSNSRAVAILGAGERLTTSDHVLIESWMLIRHRLGRVAAERYWEALRAGVAAIETVTAVDVEVAWNVADRFPDQDFSIVDRTSFAVMQRLGMYRVASFDDDFAVYRFGRGHGRAFDVVR